MTGRIASGPNVLEIATSVVDAAGFNAAFRAASNRALAAHWRAKRPRWLITCAVHSLSASARALSAGADAVFLAPVFATPSHPGRSYLGPLRARIIAKLVTVPVYALGGVDARSAR